MKAVMSRADWQQLLTAAADIVEKRSPSFAASCTLLEVEAGAIDATATDMAMTVRTAATLRGKSEPGKWLLPAKDLLDRIRACPEGDVEVKVSKDGAAIKGGKRKFSLRALSADEFPRVGELPKNAVEVSMPAATLAQLLGAVEFAINPDPQGRFHSSWLRFDGKVGVRVDAMTNSGMATAWALLDDPPVTEALLSLKATTSVRKICEAAEEEAEVQLEITASMMRVTLGQTELTFPLVAQPMPDMDQHLGEPKAKFVVDREALTDSIRSVSVAVDGAVQLTAKGGELRLEGKSEAGTVTDSLECEGAELVTALMPKELVLALGTLSSERVEIATDGGPVIVRDADGDRFVRHVRMPIVGGTR